MPEPPSLGDEAPCPWRACAYDFEQASQILEAMNFLRGKAVRAGLPENLTVIDAAFKILATADDCVIRHDKVAAPELLDSGTEEGGRYDFVQMERIVSALNFLRSEAVATRIDEIVIMIDSTFSIVATSYYLLLRYEAAKLAGTET